MKLTAEQQLWVENSVSIAWQEVAKFKIPRRITRGELVSAATYELCTASDQFDVEQPSTTFARTVCRHAIWRELRRLAFDNGTRRQRGQNHVSLTLDVASKQEVCDQVVADEDSAHLRRSIDRLPNRQRAAMLDRLAGDPHYSSTDSYALIALKRMIIP